MLTPEQQKLFRFLYLLANSYGTNFMEFEVEFDDYLSDDPLDSNTFSRSGWGKSTIEIPEKAAKELADFINENVVPKLESTLDLIFRENWIDEASQIKLNIRIDMDSRQFTSELEASWYGEEEADGSLDEMPEGVFNEIQNSVPGGNVKKATVEYLGGGDSGEWGSEIEIQTNDGRTFMVPLGNETDIWITNNLPGGWEINEGSSGTVFFNLIEKEIDVQHTWNTYNSSTETVLEFEF